MKLDLTQVILNIEGQVLKTQVKTPYQEVDKDTGETSTTYVLEEKVPTLGLLIEQALLKQDQLNKEEQLKRFNLFLLVQNKEEVELEKEDVDYIETLISARYDTFTAGRVYTLINNI